MPNRFPDASTARLIFAAATLFLSTAAARAIAAPLPPPDPIAPDHAITAAPIATALAAPTQTPAERAIAAWRQVRGLDGSGAALIRPLMSPARAEGGGVPPGDNPDDIHWQAGFGLPVPSNHISSLLPLGPLLIAGGSFERIGDLDVHGIAAWDGAKWSALGDFPSWYVLELAAYRDGLVALTSSATVWQWDGTMWNALPPFPTEPDAPAYYATAMAVNGDQVVASVWVWTEGIGYRSRVFLFDGADWGPLGGYFDEGALAFAWYNGELYAGGSFHTIDASPVPTLARWDGSAWRPVAAGLSSGRFDRVISLAVYGGELVASGWFSGGPQPIPMRYFASWNGARWAPLGTGGPSPNSSVLRLRAIGSELYATGLFQSDHLYGIARWDGTAWHTGEDQLQLVTHDVAPYQGELYAGGSISSDGERAAPLFARQRAGRWEAPLSPGEGMQGLIGWDGPSVRVIEAVDGGILAGGRIDAAGAAGEWVRTYGTARWDGARWSAFGGRSWDDQHVQDFAWHQGVLYAAGYFRLGSDYGSVARYSGGRWGLVSPPGQPFMNATCLVSALGKLFLGGGLGVGETGAVASWDGTAWQSVGGGITRGNFLTAMTEHRGELIAAGDFTEMGGVPCRNIAAWSASTGWHAMGDGLSGPVSDLTSKDGVLYASTVDCSGQGVARWKDGRWERLNTGGWVGVWALGWFQGRLIASGDGFPGGIAYLDDAGAWQPLGSGLNGTAYSFVERDRSLFVGGWFSRAGGKPAYGFAEWRGALPGNENPPPPDPSPVHTQRMVAEPNPSADAVHLRYDQPASVHARVEIYDLNGHLVDTPFDGMQAAGPQDVVWTPGPDLGAGVYFARVTSAGIHRVIRVVRVR